MSKQKISSIAVVCAPEWVWYVVGEKSNGRVVGEIARKIFNWEGVLVCLFEVRDTDGDLIATLECDVLVEYAKPEKAGEQA